MIALDIDPLTLKTTKDPVTGEIIGLTPESKQLIDALNELKKFELKSDGEAILLVSYHGGNENQDVDLWGDVVANQLNEHSFDGPIYEKYTPCRANEGQEALQHVTKLQEKGCKNILIEVMDVPRGHKTRSNLEDIGNGRLKESGQTKEEYRQELYEELEELSDEIQISGDIPEENEDYRNLYTLIQNIDLKFSQEGTEFCVLINEFGKNIYLPALAVDSSGQLLHTSFYYIDSNGIKKQTKNLQVVQAWKREKYELR